MKMIRLLALTTALCLCLSMASAADQTFFVPEYTNGSSADNPVAVGMLCIPITVAIGIAIPLMAMA